MQIWGISVDNKDPINHRALKSKTWKYFKNAVRYHDVFLLFGDPVAIKTMKMQLCQRNKGDTPYHFDTEKNILLYYDTPVSFKSQIQQRAPKEQTGYYFPYQNKENEPITDDRNPYSELRLDPLTAYCAGRCKFCQRRRYLPTASELKNRHYFPPEELIPKILQKHPELKGSFSKVERITCLTNLYNNEKKYLEDLEKMINLLKKHGFEGTFYASAAIVRSAEGIKKFYEITDGYMYPFTVEVFTNRRKLMGKIKGIKFDEIVGIFERARAAGFKPTGDSDYGKIHINYLAGLDPLKEIEKHFNILQEKNLIDTIGFNMMTVFVSAHKKLLVPEAVDLKYYYRVRSIRKGNKFKKNRIYLGVNLNKNNLRIKERTADKKLNLEKKPKSLEINKLTPKIRRILKKNKIKRAGIFGSYARGEQKKDGRL